MRGQTVAFHFEVDRNESSSGPARPLSKCAHANHHAVFILTPLSACRAQSAQAELSDSPSGESRGARERSADPRSLAPAERVINTVASARCNEAPGTLQPFSTVWLGARKAVETAGTSRRTRTPRLSGGVNERTTQTKLGGKRTRYYLLFSVCRENQCK